MELLRAKKKHISHKTITRYIMLGRGIRDKYKLERGEIFRAYRV
jgi:hypothetical protein